MVEDQETEDLHFNILKEYKRETNMDENEFLHYDTPCTVDNQIMLLKQAGFSEVKKVWREENTTMLVAKKK
jgi:hypothetical protein